MNYYILSNVNYADKALNLDFAINNKSESKTVIAESYRKQCDRAKKLGYECKSRIDEQNRIWSTFTKGDKTVNLVVCNDKNRGLL